MAENNVIYTVVTPDVPKAIPGEQLYVYVPRASFTNPGIAAFDETQFTISETAAVSIKDAYVEGAMQPTINSLKVDIKAAKDTADGAVETANTANKTADEAKTIASGIDSKATEALQRAKTAQTDATLALTKATNAEKQVDGKLDKASIVQETGTAEDKVMSQKTTTEALDKKVSKVEKGPYWRVYAVDATSGLNTYIEVSFNPLAYKIPIRDENGRLRANEAVDDKDLVNLGQLTTKLLDYLLKSGGIISGNLSIQGDLEVRGTTKTTEEETLNVKDSIVVTNSSGADLSATLAGFVIRLNATDCYGIIYDASSESVKLGKGKITDGKFTFNSGEGNAVAIRADGSLMTNGHLVKWDATALKFVDAGKSVDDFVFSTSAPWRVYITDGNGAPAFRQLLTVPGASGIPQYSSNGTLKTNTPNSDLDCVNKQYFEAKTAVLIDNSLLGG